MRHIFPLMYKIYVCKYYHVQRLLPERAPLRHNIFVLQRSLFNLLHTPMSSFSAARVSWIVSFIRILLNLHTAET